MATEPTKPTPAQELHADAMQLKSQLDAGREAKVDAAYSVGARPAIPIVVEVPGGFTPPADNGAEYPGPGVPPAPPLKK